MKIIHPTQRRLCSLATAVLLAVLCTGCAVPYETELIVYRSSVEPSADIQEEQAAVAEEIPPRDAEQNIWNVKDFGAVGNGRADDYVAIQRAVNTVLRNGGGTVYFPDGQYRISETLRITMAGEAPLTLLADSASSVALVTSADIDGPAVYINHPYVTMRHVGITDHATSSSIALVLASDYAVIDTVNLTMGNSNPAPAVQVYGAHNTLKHIATLWGTETTYVVEFTKKPGVTACDNILEDSHFGGEHKKCVLVTTEDGNNVQENLQIRRNVFLVVDCDQVEVRAAKNIYITDNMMDAAGICLLMKPQSAGIVGVQMTNNYCGASTGGERTAGIRADSDDGGTVSDVVISANYFWSPDGIYLDIADSRNVKITDNYFVLTGGTAMYLTNASDSVIEGNAVVLLNSQKSLTVKKINDNTVIRFNQLGGEIDVPDWKTRFAADN